MLNDILTPEESQLMRELVSAAERIVITCHVHPDGDAVGSSLGWAEYLRSLGKDPAIIVPDQYPDFLQWLPKTERIIRYDKRREEANELLKQADLIFLLDLNQPSRTGDMAKAIEAIPEEKRIIIDHHLATTLNCRLAVSHPEMSSTCELVFRIVWQLDAFDELTRHFASPIYCGMMTDTGGFTYNSNDPAIFHIIGLLLTKGIDKDKIYRNVYNCYSENRLRLVGYVLYEKLKVFAKQRACLFALSRQDQHRFHFIKGDAEGLVNMPLQIKGMRLSISLREDTEKDNCIRISLRSVDQFPCNKMAEKYFNGGGHLNASGGELNCSLAKAIDIAQKAIIDIESFL